MRRRRCTGFYFFSNIWRRAYRILKNDYYRVFIDTAPVRAVISLTPIPAHTPDHNESHDNNNYHQYGD
jgi:hypothetical protein